MSTQALARFAASLHNGDVPEPVRARARDCILDTVGVASFGAGLPWSGIVADLATRSGGLAEATVIGRGEKVPAGQAALANGAASHAFEMDSLRQPGTGVHPGATVAMPALAMAEAAGAGGRALVTAVVAGCEVMFRIGLATRHSAEKRGFHAPGLTGVFGSAVAAGHLMGLDETRMANALGIAASLGSGLLAFSRAGSGGMVKRLHLGRAAEGGILAASLARDGFTGPPNVIEGEFGFLEAYTAESDPDRLARGLGEEWETLRICFKRYACHVTAHTPVQAIGELMADNGVTPQDVAGLAVAAGEKVLSRHNIPVPGDMTAAQYSVPWCAALAVLRDAEDPRSFLEAGHDDPEVRGLSRRVRMEPLDLCTQPGKAWASRVALTLANGTLLERTLEHFLGTPEAPLDEAALRRRFLLLAGKGGEELYRRFAGIEELPDVRALFG
ncbi:MAG: MmgE/PrpD family protein [Acetobacterales bacterium]